MVIKACGLSSESQGLFLGKFKQNSMSSGLPRTGHLQMQPGLGPSYPVHLGKIVYTRLSLNAGHRAELLRPLAPIGPFSGCHQLFETPLSSRLLLWQACFPWSLAQICILARVEQDVQTQGGYPDSRLSQAWGVATFLTAPSV